MIEITNVNFRYAGPEPAGVKDINLCIPDGECLLLCGASGCGKTTIIFVSRMESVFYSAVRQAAEKPRSQDL